MFSNAVFHHSSLGEIREDLQSLILSNSVDESEPQLLTVFLSTSTKKSAEIIKILNSLPSVTIFDPFIGSTRGVPIDTTWIWMCDIPMVFLFEIWKPSLEESSSSVFQRMHFFQIKH